MATKAIDHDRLGGCYCEDPICYGVRTARALGCTAVSVETDAEGRRVLVMPQRRTGMIFRRFLPAR
jgi:hypothetical protein